MAIPEDHLAKFHKMTDAKEMWNAIKSRFGGNDESKKMQKYILKQQFEGFTLEISWSRNKPGMDSLSFDDLYNNLRVFENDVKGSTASSSNLQNVAFVSENTNSTNDVSTAYGVSNTSGHNSKHEQTSSSYSLLASQSSCPQLDHEDLDQVDEYDLEEMDLKWQVAMISMRIKKFYKKTGRKLQFDAKEPELIMESWNIKIGSASVDTGKKEESKALVTVDGESVDWTTSFPKMMKIDAFMASNSVRIRHTEPSELVSEPVVNELNIKLQPKSGPDASIIEDYESDSDKRYDNPHRTLKNKGIIDSGCSRHMTGNKTYLADFQDFNGGPVAFGGSKGYITGKGKIKTGKLDFEDVSFVKELQHFNLFSVSQMCDKKNKVLFTDSECLVLSPDFKLPDENQILLKVPRQNNMYSFNLENIVPLGGLACLIAKATTDESNKWHRRLGHVNFKNLNRLVKGNLVRGLPTKLFLNDHTCVACQKGKQHKASCKAKLVSSISHTLQLLHMDLFGPTSVRSINHKTYCLVITDDFSRFSWTFFLRTKDETSAILKDFIRQITPMNQKGSRGKHNARTPQQNGVAERKNRTLR
ncbi:putative ribonuclease H-like domain-containing protein [Tanacetum coccineum]